MTQRMQIEGLRELTRALRLLPRNMEARVYRSAARAGASAYRREVLSRDPDLTIRKVKIVADRRRGPFFFKVGLAKDHWQYVFKEFGTRAHQITVKAARVLGDGKGGFFGRTVSHPGQRERPVFRPALDASEPAVRQAFIDGLGRGLAREARKVAGPSGAEQVRRAERRRR